MKNTLLLGLFSAVVITFTGCSEGTKTTQNTETKSAKCGEGKCGDGKCGTDAKKEAKPAKCDASGKCGEGKCGGTKNTP